MTSRLIISLDFELMWGVRDIYNHSNYGLNVIGAREAVPRILSLFAEQGICCTWATVGFLFCENKDELIESIPALQPHYTEKKFSNYMYINEVGKNEKDDPYYFAPSLVREIQHTPGQELATHTLSHYNCLEHGQTYKEFEADIKAASDLAKRKGIQLKSIVFPKNQYDSEHLKICSHHGIETYRGNPESWAFKPAAGQKQTNFHRAARLLDSYTGLLGSNSFQIVRDQPVNVPASRFLRPCSGSLKALQPFHIKSIKREMTKAAKEDKNYHLWWHPHNFGIELDQSMAGLREITDHFQLLNGEFNMQTATMASAACD